MARPLGAIFAKSVRKLPRKRGAGKKKGKRKKEKGKTSGLRPEPRQGSALDPPGGRLKPPPGPPNHFQ